MESKVNFLGLGIHEWLNDVLERYGITEPSPVQAEAIPHLLEGKDAIAQSQTGSGKTLAYLLPVLQQVDPERKQLQAMILAPTQELAMQIVRESERYGAEHGIMTLGLIGGAAMKRQIEKLKRHPQIVVGTPGRISELINLRKLKMHLVNTLIVDEVDQVIGLGGGSDVKKIIRSTRKDRQLVFLSATVNEEILTLANREMNDLLEIGIEPDTRTSSGIEHVYFVAEERDKLEILRRVLRHYNSPRSLVFVNDTNDIAEVEAKLNHLGLSARVLYGDANKVTRSTVLSQFREGKIKVLVASDVAARGLDIEGLNLVVSLDPAFDTDHYVHRSGRTGRMGKKGVAASIITERERFIMRKFADALHIDLQEHVLKGGAVLTLEQQQEREESYRASRAKAAAARSARPTATPSVKKETKAAEPRVSVESSVNKETNTNTSTPTARPAEREFKPRTSSPAAKVNPKTDKKKRKPKVDTKSKGAPKWLKEKRAASQDEK
ncbi:DEAD/DEAH box helicase [Paenibacillus nicotianae]|uniref:RNA helicase n=1 Tax=Paenibacillus nicotianae TaxID=1526551 RepID=A0ABW4UQ03_9BACL